MRVAGTLGFCVLLLASPVSAQRADTTSVDYIALLRARPDLINALGLSKLTAAELTAWNGLLNQIAKSKGPEPTARQTPAAPARANTRATTSVYVTKVESSEDDVIRLRNGAIVEVTSGYVGYVSYSKNAVLFQDGSRWKIWIEGKKAFSCDVLKAPVVKGASAERVYISEVKGNGQLLFLLDGGILEVGSLNRLDTGLWLGMSDALLLEDGRLLNLNETGGLVDVTRVK